MKEYLKGLHFYDIRIRVRASAMSYNYRACTYRQMGEIERAFDEQKASKKIFSYQASELDHDWVIDDEHYFFPMFCVELSKAYITINELVEDILVGKLSGILDVDLDKIMEENNG